MMFADAVHWFAATEKKGEFVCQLILTFYQSISQLVMAGNPVTGGCMKDVSLQPT